MNQLIQLFHQHEVLATTIGLALWNAYVGSLDAPTKESGPGYVFLFRFSNALAMNFHRAAGTSIENSPNFVAAAENYMAEQKRIQKQFDDMRAETLKLQAQPLAIHTDWQQQPTPPEEKPQQ